MGGGPGGSRTVHGEVARRGGKKKLGAPRSSHALPPKAWGGGAAVEIQEVVDLSG